ncbi:MAG: hypothetical protein DI559_08745, partial [Ectopseudomonas oleovorans]
PGRKNYTKSISRKSSQTLSTARPGGDGFGLSLAIARSMIETQGGRVWAENGRHGLRVSLCMPAA